MATEQVDLRGFRGEPALKAEEVLARKRHLSALGFSDPWINGVSQVRPSLWAPEVVNEHLNGLTERGFNNPNKMVESLPAILGYAFENIDAKLAGLRERGFNNPNKMVESSPAILGLAFENIDRRLKLYGRLIRQYDLPFVPPQLMEKDFFLFSSKLDKVLVLTRILRDYQVTPPNLNESMIRRLVRYNLEDTLVALASANPEEGIKTLLSRINSVRKERLPKEEKREIIDSSFDDDSKIKRRYFRGYSK